MPRRWRLRGIDVGPPSIRSDAVDAIEAMRSAGRLQEALTVLERFLTAKPGQPRALLVRSRIFYDLGNMNQAVEALRDLSRRIGNDRAQSILGAIERLRDSGKPSSDPAFATESMARLLAQQGYFLEAQEIYRGLYEASPEKIELASEVARLKTIVEREGSRGATRETMARELEVCDLWLKRHSRG